METGKEKRLSASNIARICKMTERTDKQFFVTSLIVKKDIQTPAINHGKAYESIAVKNMKKKPTLKHECGCLISTQCYMRHLIKLLIQI